ncbi:hypothetical protein TNCV_3338851, partial [Trichonephila clavipes]
MWLTHHDPNASKKEKETIAKNEEGDCNLKDVKPTEPPYLYEIVWAKMTGYPPWPGL